MCTAFLYGSVPPSPTYGSSGVLQTFQDICTCTFTSPKYTYIYIYTHICIYAYIIFMYVYLYIYICIFIIYVYYIYDVFTWCCTPCIFECIYIHIVCLWMMYTWMLHVGLGISQMKNVFTGWLYPCVATYMCIYICIYAVWWLVRVEVEKTLKLQKAKYP